MKNITKLFFTFLIAFTLLVNFPVITFAAVPTPELQIKIGSFGSKSDFQPGYQELACDPNNAKAGVCVQIGWLNQYIGAIFKYGIGLAAILAVVMIMVGGFMWLTSGGSPSQVGRAKEYITSSIIGLLIALFSYTILYTINPRLVANEPLTVKNVASVDNTCCKQPDNTYKTEGTLTNGLCKGGSEPVDSVLCNLPNQQCGERDAQCSGSKPCCDGYECVYRGEFGICQPKGCKTGGTKCDQSNPSECCSGFCNYVAEAKEYYCSD